MLSVSKENIPEGQGRPMECQCATSDTKEQDLNTAFTKYVLLNLPAYAEITIQHMD